MKSKLYRIIMRLAHKYNWHYAPPIHPGGDTLLWCKWCGLRYTKHRLSDYVDCLFDKDIKSAIGRKVLDKEIDNAIDGLAWEVKEKLERSKHDPHQPIRRNK